MLIKTRGIVLRTKKYSETSVITDIYTEAKGLRSYIISGVRSKRAKVGAALLQIMSLVDIVAYHRDDKDLTRLKEIKPLYVYKTIPFDFRRSAVGMLMTEVTRKTIHEQEEQPELFDFLLKSFLFLDETSESIANIHLQFLLNLTEYIGFMPSDSFSEETPYFDLKEGCFSPINPAHQYWLEKDLSELFSLLLHAPKEQVHSIIMTREQRRNLLRHILDYYRLHIENFPTINSHEILEEVMG